MVVSQTKIIQSIDPATKEVIGEVPVMHGSEVIATVKKSWKAFETWQLTPYHQRIKRILAMRRVIESRADEIAELVSREVGKPLPEAYLSELTGPLDTCVWLAENVERILKDQVIHLSNPLLSTKQTLIAFEPLGVVGIISPWNYPFAIPMMTMLMCVAAGNTVVLKPSEKSPLTGLIIGKLFQLAKFPDDVVSIITGDRTTGEHLTRSRLAKLIFTGSVEGGSKVMAQCAPNLTPVSLELGGKDPAIVLPHAPPEWTAHGLVWGAFTNAGQACASIERVYLVKGKNNERLINAVVARTKELKLGAATDPTTDVGPLIDEIQLAKVDAQVRQAEQMGARILCGGKRRDDLGGYFFEPTVITDVNNDMELMTEETFGPVMPIVIVDTEDQAVELANDSKFGLTASVWAKDLARAEAVARDINTGTVLINDVLISHACPQVPWGGLKKSGFGRSHSSFGLMDLVNIKHISLDSSGGPHRLWWYQYGPARIKTARAGLKLLHGTFPFGKMKGLFGMLANMFRKPKGN